MYIPRHFEENRTEVLHGLIRARPLATLVTVGAGGLDANHVPLLLDELPAPLGTLRGHIARANPLSAAIGTGLAALAVFHGPDAYISPSWYATKRETGEVVPTWNYAVVHAHGTLRLVDDAAHLHAHLRQLTAHNEAGMPEPWTVADAPAEYIERLMRAIIGVEFTIERLTGKWKTSQNQPPRNRAGVVEGLRAGSQPWKDAMAALVESH